MFMESVPRLILASRLAIGIGAWVAPDTTVRLFGIDPGRSDRFVGRLFGAREFALAASTLLAPPSARRTVALSGVAIDVADVISGLDERRRGNLGTRATLLGPIGAITFVVAGVLAAREAE